MPKDRPDRQTMSRLDIAALVRDARQLAGLSQTALAEQLGTKQSVVSRWERGLDEPRVSTLARLLQACGFEADLVFRRHDDEDRAQIRQLLAMEPDARLAGVANVSRMLAGARRVPVDA